MGVVGGGAWLRPPKLGHSSFCSSITFSAGDLPEAESHCQDLAHAQPPTPNRAPAPGALQSIETTQMLYTLSYSALREG